jgi:hypothetical protein
MNNESKNVKKETGPFLMIIIEVSNFDTYMIR